MANLSQIQVGGTTYDICDTTARDSISQKIPYDVCYGTDLIGGAGSAIAMRAGNIVCGFIHRTDVNLPDTYTWYNVATFDLSTLSVSTLYEACALGDISGGGPEYGTTGHDVIVSGLTATVRMQTSTAYTTNRMIRILMIAYVN